MRRLITLVLGASALLASLLVHAGDCPVALPLDMYAQRSTYHGECANGLAHGQGRIAVVYKANGKRFAGTLSGQFADGTPNGPGSFVTDDGQKRFDGIFRDGAMWEGRATSVDQDGIAWVDEFQGGRPVSRQPMRPAYGERNTHTSPDDARSHQGNGYAQEQSQQPNLFSDLVSGIAQAAIQSGSQALERKYQEKYGGQQVDPAQRTLEEHREIKRRNREALEAERAQRHKARENAWKKEQAQREREKVQRQAALNRQSRVQEAERARQAEADQQRFEEQRRQDEARLAEFYADRERRRQERDAAREQERAHQQEIARQKDEARWQGAEQERIQQQEFYRQIEEDRQARLDRANQESAARQAEIERLAQQDLDQREEARRQQFENQQTLIDQPKTTESPQNTPAPPQQMSEAQREEARQKVGSQTSTSVNQSSRALTYEDVLTKEELAWSDSLPHIYKATTQFSPAQISEIKKDGRWGPWVEQTKQAAAPSAATNRNTQSPTQNRQTAPSTSTPQNMPLRYEDVLSPQEIAWMESLPENNTMRNLPPETIDRLKREGRWNTWVDGTNDAIQSITQDEAGKAKIEKRVDVGLKSTAIAGQAAETALAFVSGGTSTAVGVAGKKAVGKVVTEVVENRTEKEVVEQAAKSVVDETVVAGTKRSEVWSWNPFSRGRAYEKARGQNLPGPFRGVDKFENGVVTSIKTIDLDSNTYQDASKLRSKLKGYVDDVADFKGAKMRDILRMKTVEIKESDIVKREIDLGVPHGGSEAQQDVINQIIQYGESRGVSVSVNVWP